MVADSKNTSL
ncbi:hypothetical protein YPPY54_3791, partial [Yersinia pestis PY-54]